MKIESLKIKNFKAFKNAEMKAIPNFCVIVGANGSGKSTLFNVFAFLREAINSNVQTALIKQGGGKGLEEVRSRNATGDIEIEIKFRDERVKTPSGRNPLVTYLLRIGQKDNRAIVTQEILKYRRTEQGRPWAFLNFQNGKGYAVTAEGLETATKEEDLTREEQQLKFPDILAIKGLAQFEKFEAVMALGDLIEKWHLSDIHISKARQEPLISHAEHLSLEGENLSLVIDYLYKNHKSILDKITKQLKHRIPGIEEVTTQTIETGAILLKIKDRSFSEPFLVRYVSDGTIKMLAYLVLLYDPQPHPLLCVEEPENQLYPKLLEELAEEFRAYANKGGQVFVSTHSPDFLNAVGIEEVFLLVKEKGYTFIKPASSDEQIKTYMEEGDKMGYLWKQGFFPGVDPR